MTSFSRFNSNIILFIVSFVMLSLNFSGHLLSTLPLKKFLDGEFPSERFAFSRLVYNLEHGTEAAGGFLLRYEDAEPLYKSVDRDDYTAFKEKVTQESESTTQAYYSHAGLQDDLVFPLWQGLENLKAHILKNAREGSRWHKRLQTLDWYYYNLISQTIIALVNALVIGLFVLWVGKSFKPAHGWLVLAMLLLLSPVLTFYGRSIWWMMWSWFLPMMITLWGLYGCKENRPKLVRNIVLAFMVMIAIFTKTAMGYEFVSTIMVSALVPVVFYAVLNSWRFWQWVRVSIIFGVACFVGFVMAVLYHWNLIEALGRDPAQFFQSHFEMRSSGGETLSPDSVMYKSTQASLLSVILGYLIKTKELSIPQIILMVPLLVWLKKNIKTKRFDFYKKWSKIDQAFVASISVSLLGGISMLMILKGHAYIHGYDIVIWMIPMNLLLFTFYALRLVPFTLNRE